MTPSHLPNPLRVLLTFVVVLMLSSLHSVAADATGKFMSGGGAGGETCPSFLNAMATARQRGGVNSAAGGNLISAFAMYVLGFQTGYNMQTYEVFDVFGSLGADPSAMVLYAIEPWCSKHPESTFADGLLNLVST